MGVLVTADKAIQIMDILRRNPNALKPVPSKPKASAKPLHMVALSEVVQADIPLTYTVTVGGKEHHLHLSDGYADSESPGAPTVSRYNAVLTALGNRATLDENATFSEVCRAHTAIYNRVVKKTLPVPDGTKLEPEGAEQSTPAAEAAPTPKEAKPVKQASKEPLPRPYVWVKNGTEERITERQWLQRVRMCGGIDRVPVGCGEVGDEFAPPVLLADNAEPEIEWVDDIPYVVETDEPEVAAVLVQAPEPEAKAKQPMSLARALEILGV